MEMVPCYCDGGSENLDSHAHQKPCPRAPFTAIDKILCAVIYGGIVIASVLLV